MIELNQPVDMNGVDIPIDTCCLYDEQGNEHEVQEWVYNQTTKKWSFKSEGSDGYDPGLFCVSNLPSLRVGMEGCGAARILGADISIAVDALPTMTAQTMSFRTSRHAFCSEVRGTRYCKYEELH